ncbi:receptor activity-modifying protein 1-like [Dunckerocampus dactyliophorus]|uniref:receptor activity-modifying protein 1-like n=1 Tax=Dunckerocampus dactyliophorus TaxID=161453 RepID=UPI00240580CD|nr:receptor activity-modifying protein 1-like [Dunckerocampus dactyliophorus]
MMVFTYILLAFAFFCTGLSVKIIQPCDKHMFESNVHICRSVFNKSMETSGYHERCTWPAVKRIYNTLKLCVDHWANTSLCRSRGSLVDDFFQEVHQKYFASCGQVHDPPLTTLIMLIAPGVIATLFLPLLCMKLTTRE